jgi:hypothetical protein
MANNTWKDMGFKIDNASTAITDISSWVNSASIQSAITVLESTGMGATSRTKQNGLPNISLPINGFVNTTTMGIFGPLVNGTSVNKKFEFKVYTNKYFTGSCIPANVQFSGTPDTLETFSTTLEITGAVSHTSVAQT